MKNIAHLLPRPPRQIVTYKGKEFSIPASYKTIEDYISVMKWNLKNLEELDKIGNKRNSHLIPKYRKELPELTQ